MLEKISSKTKLLVPVFGLIIILISFGVFIILSSYTKITSLETLNSKITLSHLISNVVHSLQKERGLSSGFTASQNKTFRKELYLQRKRSDENIKTLLRSIDSTSLVALQEKLNTLNTIRKDVDEHKLDTQTLIQKYSSINTLLLRTITKIAKSSHIPIITQNILAYTSLLYLKENAGLQRAQGVVILSSAQHQMNSFLKFISLLAVQKENERMFFSYASEKLRHIYNEVKKTAIFKKIQLLEYSIANQQAQNNSIDPKYWYKIMTQKLDLLDKAGAAIKQDTTQKIVSELQDAKQIFLAVITLVLVSIGLFIALLVAFIRLAKDEQKLRMVMDKYIINSVTDTKGKIIEASQAFCEVSGYSKSELIGKNHNIVRHPDMPKEVFEELWREILQGNSWKGKVKNKRKDGSFYWVYAHIEPLYNAKGEIDSFISIRLDITENELLTLKVKEEEEKNKKQEKLMQQQHRLAQMGEMLSMIAHQWRQPLSAITAAAGSLSLKARLDKLDTQTTLELSEKINNFAKHLSSTIDDFRNFFKTNKTKTKTNFDVLLSNVLGIIENSLEANDIIVTKEVLSLQEFTTYENELKQVLLNLIKNAEDALVENNTPNPQISITIDGNKFSISDNAGGIREEILDKIFEPYFSTKLKKDGTGLGLYMSKLIVEDHCNGSLDVQNSAQGANFTIVLGENNDNDT